ncbi:MAG: hypothetical protein ACRES4_03465 [Nevskiales bacterium]
MREWLKALPTDERKAIGEDLKTVQFGWPLGMPLVRKTPQTDLELALRRMKEVQHG